MKKKENPARKAQRDGWELLTRHPLFAPLASGVYGMGLDDDQPGMVSVGTDRSVIINPKVKASAQEWLWAYAHAYTHLGMGHVCADAFEDLANCDEVNRFLVNLKIGERPHWVEQSPGVGRKEVLRLLKERKKLPLWGSAGNGKDVRQTPPPRWRRVNVDSQELFERGLRKAVSAAIAVAGGEIESLDQARSLKAAHRQALEWFMRNYPLLGGLAMTLEVVDQAHVIERLRVSYAAVDAAKGELYLNPDAHLTTQQWRFVIAHEMLHVGLRHDLRRLGRDPYLWNVATDFVINNYLLEMNVGELPSGVLLDVSLKGLSAEEVYRKIASDTRKYRKLMTLRGVGIGDIVGEREWVGGEDSPMDLDEHYRRALCEGLDAHVKEQRGFLPAELIEEIRALETPPVPWDVKLGQWFEEHFPQQEPQRTYARLSRRQSSSPDIPRPGRVHADDTLTTRTFAVVLDTSGSMTREQIGHALGAIASYALAREVNWVRLVFCDAMPYDQGYVRPEDIAQRVQVHGRGGTILQPAVDLVEESEDFPPDGPILIITDGWIEENLKVRREHAYLLSGPSLPFNPRGPVFKM